MNRTQKKCLIASLATHGFLLLMLIVGPAFVTSKPLSNDLPLLDVIPATLVDEMISSGGTPAPVTPKPASPAPTPAPPVAAPAVQPEPVQPAPPKPEVKTAKPPKNEPEDQEESQPEPEPVKNVVKNTPDPDALLIEPPKKTKKQVVLNLKKTVTRKVGGKSHGADEKAREEAEARAEEKAQAKAYAAAQASRRAALTGAISDIRGGLSGTVKIEGIGDGAGGGMGGGAAAANYAQAIRSIFDKAWYDPPKEVTDNSLNVEVKINIARSGRIVSARVSGPSGNSTLDRSVRRALDRVQSVPPFPAGATDLDRTYTIIFNLKSKRPLG
jgi:TonB family protein